MPDRGPRFQPRNAKLTWAPSCRVSGWPNCDGEKVGATWTETPNRPLGAGSTNVRVARLWIVQRRVTVRPCGGTSVITTWPGTSGPPQLLRDSSTTTLPAGPAVYRVYEASAPIHPSPSTPPVVVAS